MLQLFARRALPPLLERRSLSYSLPICAGHNKWSKIKDKKGANDAQKSILYSRATKDIGIAVKVGGGLDPETNIHLATALKRAKEQGVPKDNIERALSKAAGSKNESGTLVTYEALVGGSVGVIVECVTDNVNRTLHSIREILNAHNARMAPVKFMFKRSGCITLQLDVAANEASDLEAEIMDICTENDAEDIISEEPEPDGPQTIRVLCDSKNLVSIEKALTDKEGPWPVKVTSAEMAYLPMEREEADAELEEAVHELVEKLEEPTNEPLSRAATAIVEDPNAPSFRIGRRATYKHQYSNIYWQRLRMLRPVIQERAVKQWSKLQGNPKLVKRVLDVEKAELCYIVGTVYMEMPLKPNVMEAIARDNSIAPPPPLPKIYSPDDNVMLEDESGRIHLVGDALKDARLVTGVIIGALGMEAQDGSFEVVDICTAGMCPQPSLEDDNDSDNAMDVDGGSDDSDEWIAAVSGLEFGSDESTDAQVQMLVEFLTGEGGAARDQASVTRISRLIIAGDSLARITQNIPENAPSQDDKKAKRYGYNPSTFSPHPIFNLSSMLFDLANSLPIHILPGETDPAGAILPQQPFPRAMFGNASRFPTLICETNPTYLSVTSDVDSAAPSKQAVTRSLLINSGQPLNDIFKYLPTPPNTRLSMLESTLRWRHMAPTAPDTLWCHPYSDGDPFLIQQTPDIYIVGGQKKFGTKLVKEYEKTGSRRPGKLLARSRIVMVPSFARTGVVALINLRSLNVRCIKFSVKGMSAGVSKQGDGNDMKTSREPSPALNASQEIAESSQLA